MHMKFIPALGDLEVLALIQDEGVTINGKFYPWADAPEVVEYGQERGANVVCMTRAHTYSIEPSTWVNPNPPPHPEVDPEAQAQAALEAWRADKTAEKWQLKTVMGPQAWAVVQAIEADPTIILGDGGGADISAQIWAVKTAIADVQTVPRVSELVEMLRYALGWSNEFADDVFRQAGAVRR